MVQTVIPYIVQQITEQVAARPQSESPSNPHLGIDRMGREIGSHNMLEDASKESKVAQPEKFLGKRRNEVYCWFAQLRLVFSGKS